MTIINTRDGSEDLRAFPQLFPKRQETGKRSERVENYGKIILNTRQNAKNRIPQVLRISQYRNFRSELPKYRMKNWPLPQYRKPQCPPPTNILRNVSAAIEDNLPSLAFKLFAAFTKTWLSIRNRRNNDFSICPRSSVRQPPRFEGHEIEANLK